MKCGFPFLPFRSRFPLPVELRRLSPTAAALLVALACQAEGEGPPPPGASIGDSIRLVVLTGAEIDPAAVEDRLRPVVGETRVERLFPDVDPADDPDRLSQMFQVEAPQGRLQGERGWDAAYRIQEATGFERVEPDVESTLVGAESGERGWCQVDDSVVPPENHAWSLDVMRVPQAWARTPKPGGRARGEGVLICHPDTGWSEHRDLDASALDLTLARRILRDGPDDARDPLDYSGLLLHPGHGTATGSVIVSRLERGSITGVAPAARLVPVRTARSVIQVFDSDLAKAVNHSVDAGCDVISMSLGGRAFFGLESAIRKARRENVIVLAAAGNCVRSVVAPAAYDDCLAIAATNIHDLPWKGSSRGRKVSVSAPGEHVWTARRSRVADPDSMVTPGQGTSFAVASTAGVAALWLAHNAFDRVTYRGTRPLQDVFLQALQESARRPSHWSSLDGKYGAGVVNAEALLRWNIPDTMSAGGGERALPQSHLGILANVVDRDPPELAAELAARFGVPSDSVGAILDRYGPELIQLALIDPEEFERYLDEPAGSASGERSRSELSLRASRRLGQVIR